MIRSRTEGNAWGVMVQMDWEPEGTLEQLGTSLGSDDRRVASDLERFKEMIDSQRSEPCVWHGKVAPGRVEHR